MKNIKYIIFCVAALVMGACSDFMDQSPYSELPYDDYFRNTNEVYSGVIGCYNQLQAVMQYEWAVTELRTDNTRVAKSGSSTAATKELVQLDQSALLTSNSYANTYWEECYTGIYRCNNVLQYMHVVTEPSLKMRFEGELRFMRAHLYFNLVRLWGPIFLMDKPIEPGLARYKQRSTLDEVYAFIVDDLKTVVDGNMLPARSAMDKSESGRVVMEAAKATLAKVYMTHFPASADEYTEASRLLGEVIASCGDPQSGANMVDYQWIFSADNEMNDEIIFTVRYKSGGYGLGSPFGNYFAPMLSGSNVVQGTVSGYNYVTNNINTFFNTEPDDLRIDPSYANGYLNKATGVWLYETSSGGAGQSRYIKKYINEGQLKFEGDCDWPIIRLADVMLLYAETLTELQTGDPMKYVNIVRDRAGLDAVDASSIVEYRNAIRTERRKELAFENHRFWDLVRWGIAVETINAFIPTEGIYSSGSGASNYPFKPIEEWCLLLPIPQKVMNINPSLAQNAGY